MRTAFAYIGSTKERGRFYCIPFHQLEKMEFGDDMYVKAYSSEYTLVPVRFSSYKKKNGYVKVKYGLNKWVDVDPSDCFCLRRSLGVAPTVILRGQNGFVRTPNLDDSNKSMKSNKKLGIGYWHNEKYSSFNVTHLDSGLLIDSFTDERLARDFIGLLMEIRGGDPLDMDIIKDMGCRDKFYSQCITANKMLLGYNIEEDTEIEEEE